VFLSYALEDRKAAEKIRAGLIKRGLSVWDAFSDVPVGANFALNTGEALKRSDAVIAPRLAGLCQITVDGERSRIRPDPATIRGPARDPDGQADAHLPLDS